MRYDIQILRAISVLAVICFHLSPHFRFGYLGVEIFFIISGFVIYATSHKLVHSDISEIKFYFIRRVKRIFPPLVLVLLISSVLMLKFSPDFYTNRSIPGAVYALIGISNLYYYSLGDYFDASSDFKPFLHTWSLSVELQFYFIFGLVIVILKVVKLEKFLVLCIVIIFAFSIIINLLPYFDKYEFYSPIHRIWLFTLGNLLSFYNSNYKHGIRIRDTEIFFIIIKCFTLLLVLVFIFRFTCSENEGLVFVFSKIILILTCFFILAGDLKLFKNIMFLPAVQLGNISYEIYLVHQPIVFFIRSSTVENLTIKEFILIFFLILVFAVVLHLFVKRITILSSRKIYFSTLLLLLLAINFKNPVIDYFFSLGEKVTYSGGKLCDVKSNDAYQFCSFGHHDAPVDAVFLGDSHVLSLHSSLEDVATKKNLHVHTVKLQNCQSLPILYVDLKLRDKCESDLATFYEDYGGMRSDIFLFNRWSSKISADGVARVDYSPFDNISEERNGSRSYYLVSNQSKADYGNDLVRELDEFISRLNEQFDKVVLIAPLPEFGVNVGLLRHLLNTSGNYEKYKKFLDYPHAKYLERHSFFYQLISQLSEKFEVKWIDRVFCGEVCSLYQNGKYLYLDDDHLSDEGAVKLLNFIWPDKGEM